MGTRPRSARGSWTATGGRRGAPPQPRCLPGAAAFTQTRLLFVTEGPARSVDITAALCPPIWVAQDTRTLGVLVGACSNQEGP